MAKVEFADMFKTVSGAVTKINKKSPHAKDQKMVLCTHRTAATTNVGGCNRIYLRGLSSVTRTTAPSQRELAARLRFATVAAAVKTRSQDLNYINTDQAAFLAQKDLPTGKKTLKAYLWSVCGDAYDAQHNG